MEQGQIQVHKQEQVLKQTQTISQQQLLQAQLVELPIGQLIDRVNTEMNDNPALESAPQNDYADDMYQADSDDMDLSDDTDDYETLNEREERRSALDDALSNIGRDDEELPVYQGGFNTQDAENEERIYGTDQSFYDQLREQMLEIPLSEQEKVILDYLIGSLDYDGILRKSNEAISDELAVYHNVYVSEKEIQQVVEILQDFDPAGIGAHDLRECLLLQIRRKGDSILKTLMTKVISDYFDEFTKKHWDKISASLNLSPLQAETLYGELRRLNPKPGAAMGESSGRNLQQITPDFIVDTQDDGTVTFMLNQAELPELHVSQSFSDTLQEYQNHKEGMSRQMKEALLYTKQKIEAARNFIDAIKTRRETLITTMQAIIHWQHRFFEDGDEASLRPMILKDIAEKTGLDISTVSRVSNSKYAQTRWGTFPLRHFFSDGYVTQNGEELSTRQIKAALRDLITAEDKQSPLSDDALKDKLAKIGFPIARRTVSKYREQMGIPVARLRKQI